MRPGPLRIVAVISVLAAVVQAPAAASDVDGARLRQLAADARDGDAASLTELRAVTSVDGIAVEMSTVLDGSRAELQARLETLATGDPQPGALSVSEARETAADILADPEYRQVTGEAAISLRERISEWIVERLPAPIATALTSAWFWLALGAIAVALIVAAALRTARRRVERARTAASGVVGGEEPTLTAGELEGAAAAAESSGDLDEAVRLRFKAGLVRLGESGAIAYRESLSTAAVRRLVRSEDLDVLARVFDRIHYGGDRAVPADLAQSRALWPRVHAGVATPHG